MPACQLLLGPGVAKMHEAQSLVLPAPGGVGLVGRSGIVQWLPAPALGRKACALAPLLLGCVALGKLLSFSGP